jgi:hypothetical protein
MTTVITPQDEAAVATGNGDRDDRTVQIAGRIVRAGDHTIGHLARTPGDPDSDCALPNDEPVVRIGTGETYCLPDTAALG